MENCRAGRWWQRSGLVKLERGYRTARKGCETGARVDGILQRNFPGFSVALFESFACAFSAMPTLNRFSKRGELVTFGGVRAARFLRRMTCWVFAIFFSHEAVRAVPFRDTLTPTDLKQMSVEDLLNQEVISASRRPERLSATPSNVFLITGEGAHRAGAYTLPQVLRLAPNLFVAQSTSSFWAVNARGFVRANGFSNKLLVRVDGRSVYSPFYSNVFWDAQDVFAPDLEQVEVLNGPNGASWGANAVNGVINIRSKPARKTQGTLMYVNAGTNDDTSLGVRYGAKFGKTGALRVYAKHTEHGATLDARGVEDGFDSWKTSQVGFRSDWGVMGASEFTFQGDAFSGRYQNGADPDTRSDGANMQLRWTRTLAPESQVTARIYHDYTMRDMQQVLVETLHATDLELQHRIGFGGTQQILWGGNYRLMNDRIAETVGFAVLPANLQFGLGGLFFQHDIGFRENAVRVTSGVRVEQNYFSGWEYQPSLRVAWDAFRGSTLWAAASRATRTPSRLEAGLYVPKESPYVIAGGPDFKSEVLSAYELGWRAQVARGASVTTTVFYHDYDHLSTMEPNNPTIIANGGDGRSYGVEFFTDWDVTSWWRFRAAYFRTEQVTGLKAGSRDTSFGLAESSYPAHQAMLRNIFQLRRDLTLWTSLRKVGEVPVFENGRMSDVPDYTELDVCLTWQLRRNVELAVTGRNLLDNAHPEIGTVAMRREIKRNGRVTLRWGF